MNFDEVVKYCPRCGSNGFPQKSRHFFLCDGCGFRFHINAATAVAGIVTDNAGRILLIRRARDPGKGKFSVPGGFVDAGETAEAALVREMREEVNLQLVAFEFLCSYPNPYTYHGVVFPVVDLIFVGKTLSLEPLTASEEVAEYSLLKPQDIDLDEVAFPSIRHALTVYANKRQS